MNGGEGAVIFLIGIVAGWVVHDWAMREKAKKALKQ